MEDLQAVALALAGIVVAGVEATKRVGLPSRWAPVAALVWAGVVAALARSAGVAGLAAASWPTVALVAIISALIAAGAYSGAKTVARG